MKNFLMFLVIAVVMFPFSVSASPTERSTSHGVALDPVRVTEMWNKVDNFNLAKKRNITRPENLGVEQANAVIEVTRSGEHVSAIFKSLDIVPEGSYISSRYVMPNGKGVLLEGYVVGGDWQISSELWNGQFPGAWPMGYMLFETIIVSSQDGSFSYTSAYVPVRVCCSLTGPLQRAEVLPDGSINVYGSLYGRVVATVDGQPHQVDLSYDTNTGASLVGHIAVPNFGAREMLLTLCSQGVCSTRHLYLP